MYRGTGEGNPFSFPCRNYCAVCSMFLCPSCAVPLALAAVQPIPFRGSTKPRRHRFPSKIRDVNFTTLVRRMRHQLNARSQPLRPPTH
jgi:hypothetical protein